LDDLNLLVAQFADVHRTLLCLRGPGSSASALIAVQSPAIADTLVKMLDGYPLAGGLLEVEVCGRPCEWLHRAMGQVGACCFLHRSRRRRHLALCPTLCK
jgi:hypothetical protein